MVGKQFSISVLNLATSIGTNRRNSAIATMTESTSIEQRKHALSEESLPSMVMLNNIARDFFVVILSIYKTFGFNLLSHGAREREFIYL